MMINSTKAHELGHANAIVSIINRHKDDPKYFSDKKAICVVYAGHNFIAKHEQLEEYPDIIVYYKQSDGTFKNQGKTFHPSMINFTDDEIKECAVAGYNSESKFTLSKLDILLGCFRSYWIDEWIYRRIQTLKSKIYWNDMRILELATNPYNKTSDGMICKTVKKQCKYKNRNTKLERKLNVLYRIYKNYRVHDRAYALHTDVFRESAANMEEAYDELLIEIKSLKDINS